MAYIWQISIIQFKEKCIINGTILSGKHNPRRKDYKLNLIPFTYLQKPLANHPIKILYGSEKCTISTDQYGSFSTECKYHASEEIKVFTDNEELKITQSYPKVFRNSDYPLMVISDIDDTVLVSYTLSLWKRVITLLFISPKKREIISFTKEILNYLSTREARVFYVSKSESNLFRLLSSVIQKQGLPNGNLFLTPFLRYSQLLTSKKGKDFKELAIKRILDNSKGKKIILIGDDTQQDINVYTNIAEQYPERIFKIYIRRTRKHIISNIRNQITRLRNLDVPFRFFENRGDVEDEIKLIQELRNW